MCCISENEKTDGAVTEDNDGDVRWTEGVTSGMHQRSDFREIVAVDGSVEDDSFVFMFGVKHVDVVREHDVP